MSPQLCRAITPPPCLLQAAAALTARAADSVGEHCHQVQTQLLRIPHAGKTFCKSPLFSP